VPDEKDGFGFEFILCKRLLHERCTDE